MPKDKILILLIDPDVKALADRRGQLKGAGFEVLTARTGKEGLALFVAGPVDLAVIAHQMSDMAGEFVAAWMKTINPKVSVVMFSPSGGPSKRQVRYVDAFLSATAPWPQILSAIDKLLDRATTFWDCWWREWKQRAKYRGRTPQPLDYTLPEWWRSG